MFANSHARGNQRGLKVCAAAAVLGLAASTAAADTHSWVGLNAYYWWDYGDNWAPVGQPVNGDSAVVYRSGAGSYTVFYWNTAYPTAVLSSLYLDQTGGGSVGLNIGQNHYLTVQNEYIGYRSDGRGVVTQSTGTHTVNNDLYLGLNSASVGTYNLSAGTLVNDSGNQYIGYNGSGAFSHSGGWNIVGNSVPATLFLGRGTSSHGSYYLTNAAAHLSAGVTQIGYNGFGSFSQSNGSHAALAINLGVMEAGAGSYALVNGSLLANYYETIGVAGAGSFYHYGGTNATHDSLSIGGEATGRGYYGISGGTLSISNAAHDGRLYIGASGAGTLLQTGGVVSVNTASAGDSLILGYNSGGVGTYLLQGGTLITNGKQSVGYASTVASRFSQTGGTNHAGQLRIGELAAARGIYNLSGAGSLSVNGNEYLAYSGIGTFIQSGGNHTVEYANSFYMAFNPGSVAYYGLNSGNLNVQGQSFLGVGGSGTFAQTGGTHSAITLSIGNIYYTLGGVSSALTSTYYTTISGGTFNQTGGTHSTHDFLSLDGAYTLSGGTLSVRGGLHDGAVYIANSGRYGTFAQAGGLHFIESYGGTLPGSMAIGYGTDAFGRYTMQGGTLITNREIYVGMTGTGSFGQSGGVVNFGTSSLVLGTNLTPTSGRGWGTYAMSGGTLLGGSIIVGDPGFGTFTQSGGYVGVSTLKLANYRIDLATYPTGYYRLQSGTLSAGDVIVGYEGAGTFVHNGGTANLANYLVLGNRPGGPGGAYTLESPGILRVGLGEYVGFMSSGSFLQTGGTHLVDGTLTIGPASGLYTMSGGTLSAGTVQLSSGTFTQTAGTLAVAQRFVNSGQATIAGVQKWAPGALFQNAWTGCAATFNTDAGSPASRTLTVQLLTGTTTFNSTQHLSALALQNGSVARLSEDGGRVLVTGSLSIESSPNPLAKLDLANNDMIWDYGAVSPIDTVHSHIRHAWNAGAWDRNGITSSSGNASTYALGFGDNATMGLSSFSGQSVDATSVLVKYTYYGDADLNGKVDVNDLGILATHWQQPGPWSWGDFDYSGVVNVADLGMLATNWQAGTGTPLAPDFASAAATLGLPTSAIPEPGGAICLALASLLPRRWRRVQTATG
jgi:hypothetical protein